MHVLIAFDKFKDSMTALQACDIAHKVIAEDHPEWTIETAPLTDGGEGFCQILTTSAKGRCEAVHVLGPQLKPQTAQIGMVDLQQVSEIIRDRLNLQAFGKLAIIEMAQASGIEAIPYRQRDPWKSSTYGTGQLIAHAAQLGVNGILLGVGGSATNDIGLGALQAIGVEFLDRERTPMTHVTPQDWPKVKHISGAVWPHIPPISIACDVINPLLGPAGCTAVFGPQKGLNPADANRFEKLLGTLAKQLCHFCGKPKMAMAEKGVGAAGGIAFGLRVACDAQLWPGFELVEEWLNLKAKIRRADIIITGEGCFDNSSLHGKGPGSILKYAHKPHQTVAVFAGKVEPRLAVPKNVSLTAISNSKLSLLEALEQSPTSLAQALRDCPLLA